MGKGLFGALVCALVLAACSPANAQPTLSLSEFRERVASQIAETYPGARLERVDDQGLTVMLPGAEEPSHLFLARLHSIYEGNPEDLESIIRRAVSLGGASQGVTATPENLIVIVRPTSYDFARQTGDPADRPLSRPIVGDLAAFVAVDSPETYAVTRATQLRADLSMEDPEIWTRAMANTRPHLDFQRPTVPSGSVVEITTGDGLASSLLIEDAYWDSPELTAGGPLVVGVLDRDVLLVARLGDKALVAKMREGFAELSEDPNALTDQLLIRRNRRWEVLR